MFLIKKGVSVKGISNEMLLAVMVVNDVLRTHGNSCAITSVSEGVHSKGSLHYKGQAVDFRLAMKGTPVEQKYNAGLVMLMRDRLTDDYDVVLEKDHIHIEFDPK